MGSFHHPIYDHLDDPLHTGLFAYWVSRRGDRPTPAEAAFDFDDLGDLLPHLGIAQVLDGGRRFRQCYLSATVLGGAGDLCCELGPTDGKDPYCDMLRELYGEVCRHRAPIYSESVLRFGGPGHVWTMRLILPLAGLHGEVSALVFSARFARRIADALWDGRCHDRVTDLLEAKRVVYDHFSVGCVQTGFTARTGKASRAREKR